MTNHNNLAKGFFEKKGARFLNIYLDYRSVRSVTRTENVIGHPAIADGQSVVRRHADAFRGPAQRKTKARTELPPPEEATQAPKESTPN